MNCCNISSGVERTLIRGALCLKVKDKQVRGSGYIVVHLLGEFGSWSKCARLFLHC